MTLLFTLYSVILCGQDRYNLPPKQDYEKATIGLTNFQKLEVTMLSILADSIQFEKDRAIVKMPLSVVNYIRVQEGSKAKGGALIGASSMLVITLAAMAQVNTDPNYERDNTSEVVILSTLGGGLVGAIIGAATQKKTSYYVHATTK